MLRVSRGRAGRAYRASLKRQLLQNTGDMSSHLARQAMRQELWSGPPGTAADKAPVPSPRFFFNLVRSPLGESMFTDLPMKVPLYRGQDKMTFFHRDFCHLCREPVGNPLQHNGFRDHHCRMYALHMRTLYPRSWDERSVLFQAQQRFPRLHAALAANNAPLDNQHTCDDAHRRAALQSMLLSLSVKDRALASKIVPSNRHKFIQQEELQQQQQQSKRHKKGASSAAKPQEQQRRSPELVTEAPPLQQHDLTSLGLFLSGYDNECSLCHSGERVFKVNLSRMVLTMLPPCDQGIFTQFTHKCWGRSNQERLFDSLELNDVRQLLWAHVDSGARGGLPLLIPADKTEKARFLRHILFLLDLMAHSDVTAHEMWPSDAVSRVVHVELSKRLLRMLSFEMVFLMSMELMHDTNAVNRELEHPTMDDLTELGQF